LKHKFEYIGHFVVNHLEIYIPSKAFKISYNNVQQRTTLQMLPHEASFFLPLNYAFRIAFFPKEMLEKLQWFSRVYRKLKILSLFSTMLARVSLSC
jgi:hypothetical protein